MTRSFTSSDPAVINEWLNNPRQVVYQGLSAGETRAVSAAVHVAADTLDSLRAERDALESSLASALAANDELRQALAESRGQTMAAEAGERRWIALLKRREGMLDEIRRLLL